MVSTTILVSQFTAVICGFFKFHVEKIFSHKNHHISVSNVQHNDRSQVRRCQKIDLALLDRYWWLQEYGKKITTQEDDWLGTAILVIPTLYHYRITEFNIGMNIHLISNTVKGVNKRQHDDISVSSIGIVRHSNWNKTIVLCYLHEDRTKYH